MRTLRLRVKPVCASVHPTATPQPSVKSAGIFRLTIGLIYGSLSWLTEVDDLSHASAHKLLPRTESGWLRRSGGMWNRKKYKNSGNEAKKYLKTKEEG